MMNGNGTLTQNGIDQEAAMAMLAEGYTLKEVGKAFGVTRQRIQQIALRCNVESPQCAEAIVRRRTEVREGILAGLSDEEVAERVGVCVRSVGDMRRNLGLGKFAQLRKQREAALAAAEELVKGGMSVKAALKKLELPRGLAAYLSKRGVKSQAPSRWRDISYRFTLIPEMRAEGRTWKEINARLAEIDGYDYRNPQIAAAWCRLHLPHLIGSRNSKATE